MHRGEMLVSSRPPLALLLGLLACGACDQVIDAIKGGAEAVVEGAEGGAEGGGLAGGPKTADDHLAEKLDPYIDCINSFSKSIHDTADRYFSWVDHDKGLTGTEKNVYGLHELHTDPKACVDGVKTSAGIEPKDADIEAAAQAFADAVVTTHEVVNEAHKYYDEKNYKDDAFAKGKELHPKLVAAFEAFDAADKGLRELVSAQNDALQERELARIEKEMGKNLMWHNKNVMVLAKKLVRAGDVAYEPTLEIDLATFEPLVNEFEAAVDETEKYAKANKEEYDSVTSYSSFVSEAVETKKAAKELLRRKRDDKAFTKDELDRIVQGPAEWVEGSPAKLSKHYNDLVSNSNRLNWHWYKPAGSQ
jgi:hypothetical protein